MSIQIRKELNDIIVVHQRIINSFKSQNVRQIQLVEKYAEDIQQELDIPSNRYLYWTRVVKPYLDSVITSKLIENELQKEYEKFIKDIVAYEADFVRSEEEIRNLEYGFDSFLATILRLEKKIIDVRNKLTDEVYNSRIEVMHAYREIDNDVKNVKSNCLLCGVKLKDGEFQECGLCKAIPLSIKPFVIKDGSVVLNDMPKEPVKQPETIVEDFEEESYDDAELYTEDELNRKKKKSIKSDEKQEEVPEFLERVSKEKPKKAPDETAKMWELLKKAKKEGFKNL